jgi:hypothetical protein
MIKDHLLEQTAGKNPKKEVCGDPDYEIILTRTLSSTETGGLQDGL